MPTIKQNLSTVSLTDKRFVGTVAFRNEKLSLPDGSKVAIGMDGDLWVIVYQHVPGSAFVVYEFNAGKKSVVVDKKPGSAEDIGKVKEIIGYFFDHAEVDDLVTIESKRIEA